MQRNHAAKDPMVTMEDIFVDLHLKGQQMDMASPRDTEGEEVEPETTESKEFIVDKGQEEEV